MNYGAFLSRLEAYLEGADWVLLKEENYAGSRRFDPD